MTNNPKIEKNIPVPPKKSGRVYDSYFYETWSKLKPGDSLLYSEEGDYDTDMKLQRRVLNMKRDFLASRGLDWKMVTRRVEGGVRIWRIR